MKVRCLFSESLPKRFCEEASNEDFFSIAGKPIASVALSDGASESYDSRTFAKLLCEDWTGGNPNRLRVRKTMLSYAALFKAHEMHWSDAGAFERGSFATFLGGRFIQNELHVLAVGDSIVVLHGPEEIKSFPFSDPESLRAHPNLLSTLPNPNRFLKVRLATWPLRPGMRILWMTDALAAWYLQQNTKDEALGILESIVSREVFSQFVERERADGRLKNDDTTLIQMEVLNDAQ